MRPTDGHRIRLALLGLALAASAAGSALAQTTQERLSGLKLSGDQPIQIESDKLEVRESESMAIFSGDVSVVQGPTLLKAGKMTVFYAKGSGASAATGSANIDRLEVDGKVYVKSDTQVATGDKGTFDMKTEILTLSGQQVVLSEGTNVLTGCKLTVNMKSGQAEVEGCGGRVKGLFQPGSQNQPASQSQ
jgi:lipopolysaccharide export system protein LptA